jgi:hypothetical protein
MDDIETLRVMLESLRPGRNLMVPMGAPVTDDDGEVVLNQIAKRVHDWYMVYQKVGEQYLCITIDTRESEENYHRPLSPPPLELDSEDENEPGISA